MSVRRAGLLCWGVTVAAGLAGLVFLLLGPGRRVPGDLFGGIGGLSFLVLSLSFATVGAIVASRVPENRVGWVFCATGLLIGMSILAYGYASYSLYAASEQLPWTRAAAWFGIGPSEALAGLFGLSLLLFPDGRLPSPRWRAAAAVSLLGISLLFVGPGIRPGSLGDPFAQVANPLGIQSARRVADLLDALGWLLALCGLLLGARSMLIRRRKARGVERQQLKLVLAVGAVVAAATAAVIASWVIWPHGGLQIRMAAIGLTFALFPVAAGVAILRYRLYDIDVVINRALVYAALTAILAAAYAGGVLLLQAVLRPGSNLAVAGSTLAAAALVRPARARIQELVDRRFYRRRYDAAHTLERFGTRLREQVDLDALEGELHSVVVETMQPAHLSLWLRAAQR
jgi:hypothetical protein